MKTLNLTRANERRKKRILQVGPKISKNKPHACLLPIEAPLSPETKQVHRVDNTVANNVHSVHSSLVSDY